MQKLCLVLKILAFHLLIFAINAFTTPVINSRGLSFRARSDKKFYSLSREKSRPNSPEIAVNDDKPKDKLRIAVVGGGWAGYSLCESISTNNLPDERGSRGGIEIIMLDASKQAKGGLAGGYRDENKNNRPVEAGIHGFWREYRNTFDIMESIEGVKVDEVLGGFSPSVLYSKNGKVAVAPVLLDEEEVKRSNFGKTPVIKDVNEKSIRRFIAANLPPPLDLPLLAEIDNNTDKKGAGSKLRPIDLMSGLGLVGAWADFEQESSVSWKRYDTQPASLLFEKAGITDALYEEMVSPLLHVLPMCPAYDCSAAAALSCFHVFALQSRGAFDVRWCRGSISEKIFDSWQHQLEQRGVSIRGGSRVASIKKNDDDKYDISLDSMNEKKENSLIENCDAVVLAVGAVAAGKLAASSPALSSLDATKDFDKLRGVTCVAVRLFLKPHPTITSGLKGGSHDKTQLPPEFAKAMIDSPIAVCGAGIGDIEELRETGFCIYDLQRMHDEFSVDYYAAHVDKEDQVSVLEIDFYRADSFVNCQNDVIVSLALEAVSSALGTTSKIDHSVIVDSTVLRAKNAVSHFSPNSALYSPDVKLEKGLYCCGDWVDRAGHASWSTEKSVVTARQAANALSADFGLANSQCDVIPAAKDTPQLTALRKSAKLLRKLLPLETLPPSPWIFAKQFLSRHV